MAKNRTARRTAQVTLSPSDGDANQLNSVARLLKKPEAWTREQLSDAALSMLRTKLKEPGASWTDVAVHPKFSTVLVALDEALQDFIADVMAENPLL